MYKTASDLAQAGASRLKLADMMNGEFAQLPPLQQRENLVRRLLVMNAEIVKLPKGKRRSQMGQDIQELTRAISAIRPKLKGPPTVAHYFVDICREQMPRVQFSAIMDAANKRAKATAIDPPTNPQMGCSTGGAGANPNALSPAQDP